MFNSNRYRQFSKVVVPLCTPLQVTLHVFLSLKSIAPFHVSVFPLKTLVDNNHPLFWPPQYTFFLGYEQSHLCLYDLAPWESSSLYQFPWKHVMLMFGEYVNDWFRSSGAIPSVCFSMFIFGPCVKRKTLSHLKILNQKHIISWKWPHCSNPQLIIDAKKKKKRSGICFQNWVGMSHVC